MATGRAHNEPRFLPSLVKGYLLGTFAAAIALHFAIAVIVPGDGGTILALSSALILFTIMVVLSLVNLVVFPVVALVSWPVRSLVYRRPLLTLLAALLAGTGIGALFTATQFQIGPGDFWSGSVVGLVYAAVWFLVVKNEQGSGE